MNRFNNQQKTKTMIQPNEIRCGNLFHHNDNWSYREKGGYFQWSESDWYALGESTLFIENVSPIQLTPEILKKCLFDKNIIDESSTDNEYYYSMKLNDDKHCDISLISGDKNGILEVCLFPYETWFRFQYLHQLQNLYYALTGKELDISKFI